MQVNPSVHIVHYAILVLQGLHLLLESRKKTGAQLVHVFASLHSIQFGMGIEQSSQAVGERR